MTKDRDDILRQVRHLQIIADDERCGLEERDNARSLATKLRLKHGIGDDDLVEVEEEQAAFFGYKLFFFNNEIQPHLDRIQKEIDAALAKADKLDLQNKLDVYTRLYKDLHEMVEGARWFDRLKQRRDAVIKEYYETEKERYRQQRREWGREAGKELDAADLAYEEISLHEHARNYTAIHSHLRKDTIERIVGVSEKSLWDQAARHHPCVACGLNGLEGRERLGFLEWPTEADKFNREWAHVSCAKKEGRA